MGLARSALRRGARRGVHSALPRRSLIELAVGSCLAAGVALANPTAPTLVNGSAAIHQQGNLLQITNSPNAVINWKSFSIGANEITRFVQQSPASAVLNRVIGAGGAIDPSVILGALQSNGRVFLINPSGVLFGAGAQIDVAGLVASSLNLSNADFLGGRLKFTEVPGAGSVINQGNITTSAGGHVYLVGPAVTNSGIVVSPRGDVVLAAGNNVELVDPGTPNLRVEISAADNEARNLGQIIADAGRVGIYAGLMNHSGTIHADNAVATEDGRIILRATKNATLEAGSVTTASGATGGVITIESGHVTLVAGTVEAKGLGTLAGGQSTSVPLTHGKEQGEGAGKGGTIHVLGNLVGVIEYASLDASGDTGGGTVLVGGDFQGKNPGIQNAFRTHVGANTTIKADAIASGEGGNVIVWADDWTRFHGTISAKGGARSGSGGFAEVSGKASLSFHGSVDLTAAMGNAGTLLLDPQILSIVDALGNLDATLTLQSGTINFTDSVLANTLSTSQINVIGGSNNINLNAGQINFDNSTGITMGAGRSIAFATNSGLAGGGDNSITNTGGNAFSINTSGGGTASFTTAGSGAVNLTNVTLNSATGVSIIAGGAVTLGAVGATGTGTLSVTAGGAITQMANLSVAGTSSFNAGTNAITLTQAGNSFQGVLTLTGSQAVVRSNNNLSLAAVNVAGALDVEATGLTFTAPTSATSVLAVANSGNMTLNAGTTINASGAGNALSLSASSNFVNNVGAGVLSAPSGRWLVYSASPAGSTENGLTAAAGSAQPRLYNRTLAGNAPATITEPGNHLIYAAQPALTVTADNATRVYGDSNPAFTFVASGFLNDDGFTDTLAGAGLTGTLATTAVATSSVAGSPYPITRGTLDSSVGYAVTFVNGQLTVTPRPITVSANAGQSKVYGNADPAFAFSITSGSLVGADAFAGALARGAGENVGAYAINQGTLSAGANYGLTYVRDNFAITQRPITVTANNQSKVYGSADPALTFTVGGNGLAGGDTPSTAFTGALARAAGEGVTGGPYAINQGSLAANANYNVTGYTGGTLAITPAPLTVAADNKTKLTGEPNPPFTASFSGFRFADTPASLSGALMFATPATTTSASGSYPITPSGLASNNYAISYSDGVLQVTTNVPVNSTLITAVERSSHNGVPAPRFSAVEPCARIDTYLFNCQ